MKRRSTSSKIEVLNTIKSHGSAMSHEMISEKTDNLNRATIYRILNRFCEDGVMHRIVDENGKQFFALCEQCDKSNHYHNHFHFKCTLCETVECMNRELNFSLPEGYSVDNFNAMISGICKSCNTAA